MADEPEYRSKYIEAMASAAAAARSATAQEAGSSADAAAERLSAAIRAMGGAPPLQVLGFGPTVQPVTDVPNRGEVDAKVAAAEARTDAKFADLRGDLRVIGEKLDGLKGIKTTVIATGLTLFLGLGALIFAALSYGNAQFGQGLSAADIAHKAAVDAVAQVRLAPTPPAP